MEVCIFKLGLLQALGRLSFLSRSENVLKLELIVLELELIVRNQIIASCLKIRINCFNLDAFEK